MPQNHFSDRKPLQINATRCAAIPADRIKDWQLSDFIKALKFPKCISLYFF